MPIFIVSILIQVALVVHIVKTGRNTTWIWIVVMLPLAGSVAYFVVEVLPDLTNSRAGRSAGRKAQSILNPNRDFNRAADQYSIADTVDNTKRMADECYNKGLYTEARTLYQKCLHGIHADDPALMTGLARSEFMLDNHQQCKDILDRLIETNPDYKNQDAHLLYARTLDSLNLVSSALHEYETLHEYFSGPEAAYYFAVFLRQHEQVERANQILDHILEKARKSSKHYSSLHSDILRKARELRRA